MVLLAEARIGAELRTAQERGEIASREDNLRRGSEVRTADIGKTATVSDLGIPRQRAAEFKALDAAGADMIREEVEQATAESRKPSRANVIRKSKLDAAARASSGSAVNRSSACSSLVHTSTSASRRRARTKLSRCKVAVIWSR